MPVAGSDPELLHGSIDETESNVIIYDKNRKELADVIDFDLDKL